MATDFFDRQQHARRRTGVMIFYFAVAVVLIVVGVYAAFTAIVVGTHKGNTPAPPVFDPIRLAAIATITLIVIASGSLWKMASLREGGGAVARMLGGRLIDGTTTDPLERRLLNVVEEMAIASGTPVPPVYLLDEEPGINAFAAGYAPGDAAIGVTRGTIDHLDRDQIQGVIAHEFSHILNGDMRIDIRLIGILHGILLLALIGQLLMRYAGQSNYNSRPRDSNDSDKKDNSALVFLLLGLALLVIGYVGMFFAHLIKCAVSRQREFLADASAVQFTRNPGGIAGALKKIGGLSQGSKIANANAEQACHMFFGEGVPEVASWMATHPPLDERIRRLDPNFDGVYPDVDEGPIESTPEQAKEKPKGHGNLGGLGAILPGVNVGGAFPIGPAAVLDSVGAPQLRHLQYASTIRRNLPDAITEALGEPFGASALMYALLLDDDPGIRAKQLEQVSGSGAGGIADEAARLFPLVQNLGAGSRLPLVDMALPTLQQLSSGQYDWFRSNIDPLVQADQRVTLFEFALQRVLVRHLDRKFRKTRPVSVEYTAIAPLIAPVGILLSAIARIGQEGPADVQEAFLMGVGKLGPEGGAVVLAEPSACSLTEVDQALKVLNSASPAVKKHVIDACVECISADGKVTVEEAEFLRAIADSLDCPMPPLVTP